MKTPLLRLLSGVCLGIASLTSIHAATPASLDFYIGTYTFETSKGIYQASLDTKTGKITMKGLAAETDSPSFLTIHPNGKFLYAAIEHEQGAVESYSIGKNGALTKLGRESSKGAGTCHVYVDPSGKNVIASNYTGGSLTCIPINPDGTLRPASAFIQFTKKDKNPNGHAAAVLGNYLYACDLGSNEVLSFLFDPAQGALTPNTPPAFSLQAGSSPRHLAFHPDGKTLYVNNEASCGVTVFAVDADKGHLTEKQVISSLPADLKNDGKFSTAEIVCHPTGKFVYVSNRGPDSIAVYKTNADGTLTLVEIAPAKAETPRGFAIDPTGKWMVIGGQKSGTISVHKIDSATGKLTFVSEATGINQPVSFEFRKP